MTDLQKSREKRKARGQRASCRGMQKVDHAQVSNFRERGGRGGGEKNESKSTNCLLERGSQNTKKGALWGRPYLRRGGLMRRTGVQTGKLLGDGLEKVEVEGPGTRRRAPKGGISPIFAHTNSELNGSQ